MKAMILILFASALFSSGYSQVKRIVFVCEHGSAKSVIAAAYFNRIVKERNLPFEAAARLQ
jgi:arsenate reductase